MLERLLKNTAESWVTDSINTQSMTKKGHSWALVTAGRRENQKILSDFAKAVLRPHAERKNQSSTFSYF